MCSTCMIKDKDNEKIHLCSGSLSTFVTLIYNGNWMYCMSSMNPQTHTGKMEKCEFWNSDCCPNNQFSILLYCVDQHCCVHSVYFLLNIKVWETHISACYALLTARDICCISLVSQNSQSSGQKAYSTYTKNPHTPQEAHILNPDCVRAPPTAWRRHDNPLHERNKRFSSHSSIPHSEIKLILSSFLPGVFAYKLHNTNSNKTEWNRA